MSLEAEYEGFNGICPVCGQKEYRKEIKELYRQITQLKSDSDYEEVEVFLERLEEWLKKESVNA